MAEVTNKYPIFDAAYRRDSRTLYDDIRTHDPIWKFVGPQTGNHIWLMTRYEDAVAALKDPRFIMDVRKNLPPAIAKRFIADEQNEFFMAIERHMLNLDQPDHTRVRSLVHKAFTPSRVRDLRPRIEQIADDLLDAMGEHGETDLIDSYAYPLPITVIAEMLGVESEKRDDFRRWTKTILFGMSQENSQIAVMEFVQYINQLIEERRQQPTDDILSGLVYAQDDDGDQLDHMELMAMVFLLLVAGHETTVNLIGNGTLALLENPQQFDKLKANPDLINSAIEEFLRYNGPVECPTFRWAKEDVEFNGMTIKQGDIVLPSLLAANHDPTIFDDPHTLDIERNPNPHIAFGQGIHYCLGAPLARMEGTIAISKLIERFPQLELNADPQTLEWSGSLLLHGLMRLPVKY